ncbi:MAG: DUF2079 domain-containing protein, partial [Planctomycetes bacterium]|nr:DUF2079 domain-containing protein [Planctomycetota bacterium]
CLLAPESIVALPSLAQAAVKNSAFGRGGLPITSVHALAPAIAFIFLGALYGTKRVLAWIERSPRLDASAKRLVSVCIPLIILLATLGHNFGDNLVGQLNFRGESWQPVSDRRFLSVRNVFEGALYVQDAQDRAAWELIRLIPPGASVSASGDLLVPLSHRRTLLEFGMNHYNYFAADYVLLNERNMYFGAGSYRWFDDRPSRNQAIVRALVAEMLKSGDWRLVAGREGLWLLKR